MKVRVRCSFVVEIDLPDDMTQDEIRFAIEENGCPGTGVVGAAVDSAMEHGDEARVCWACNLQGKNEVLP